MANTTTLRRRFEPSVYDCVRIVAVREGTAILFSEFGLRPVRQGDVILLAANTFSGGEPDGNLTITTIYADTDYVLDQVYWQHAGLLRDRLATRDFAATIYTEPAQILHPSESQFDVLTPWLDELVTLSIDSQPVENFYRMQALWFSITHVIAPFIKTSDVRLSSTQRATPWPTAPRHRRFAPLRCEARRAAGLLRADPVRRWSVGDLAADLHLSKSQVGRLFVEAYGTSPIAYLTMLRTERMARLIRTTDDPISVIARKVGWGDPDFAARQFRRSIGMTPRKYRSMIRDRTAQMVG